MSGNQRIALVVGALVIAVVAFVIARPGDDDDSGQSAASTTPAQTETETETGTEQDTVTEEAPPPPPPKPEVTRINLRGGAVQGGPKEIDVENGDTVRIVVTSDAPDDIHLHGYDIELEAAPGQPARFKFKANLEGGFEMESHTAEDAGREPLIARIVVSPS